MMFLIPQRWEGEEGQSFNGDVVDGFDVEILRILQVQSRISLYILYPCFVEGEGEFVVYKIMHKLELAVEDKFFYWENFEFFEEGGSMGS